MSVNAVINIVLYVFTAVLALIGFLMGLARGIRNQTIRSITVALSALVSALLMKVFYNAVLRSVSGKTPWEIVQSLGVTVSDEIAEALQNMDASVVEYVVPLVVCFIILPFLFVFTFVVLSALMLIVYKIIAVALDHKKTSSAEKTAEGEPVVASSVSGPSSAQVSKATITSKSTFISSRH